MISTLFRIFQNYINYQILKLCLRKVQVLRFLRKKKADQMIFRSPLNKQIIPNRDIANGSICQVHMKTFVRAIGSLTNRLERNRLNILNQLNSSQNVSIKTPPPIDHATRHDKT